MIELEDGEYIVTKVRKHWWRIFCWGFGMGTLAIFPLILLVLFGALISSESSSGYIYIVGFLYTVWLTILWVLFFVEWTDYYLDVWVITNRRVIDIDHIGLFSRDVSTVRLEDIEDITTELHGVLAITLKFGTITLQTAGSKNEFYLLNATDPEMARKVIHELVTDAKKVFAHPND
jgi:membrane protein YdbS with pleckstrin-like domain